MDFDTFKDLVESHLLPMFPGSKADEIPDDPPKTSSLLVAQIGGANRFALRPEYNSDFRLAITRKQIFSSEERRIIGSFMWLFQQFNSMWEHQFLNDVLSDNTSRIVAYWLSKDNEATIHKLLKIYEEWAQQTYEGSRISSIVGIDTSADGIGEQIDEILSEDFGKILSNGMDSMLVVSSKGKLIKHKVIGPYDDTSSGFAPFRMLGLAQWANDGKYTVCLNRNGEILIFGEGSLLFAKRRGIWHFFPHSSLIKQLSVGTRRSWAEEVRTAVYESCLDASFTRTGACVGIIKKTMTESVKSIIKESDLLTNNTSVKARCLQRLTGQQPFQSLPRQLRQELLAIDGATVLDSKGNILAAGAILRIDAGSSSGARRAAAKALGKYGVGVKVSHDGVVQVFTGGISDEPVITFG